MSHIVFFTFHTLIRWSTIGKVLNHLLSEHVFRMPPRWSCNQLMRPFLTVVYVGGQVTNPTAGLLSKKKKQHQGGSVISLAGCGRRPLRENERFFLPFASPARTLPRQSRSASRFRCCFRRHLAPVPAAAPSGSQVISLAEDPGWVGVAGRGKRLRRDVVGLGGFLAGWGLP